MSEIKNQNTDIVSELLSGLTATDTTAANVKKIVDECIKFTKEGKEPYVYANVSYDGVRYGMSLSFHYIEGEFKKFVKFVNYGAQDEEFIENVRSLIELYLSCSDVRNSKSFLRKVKRNCISVDEANFSTECMFTISQQHNV